MKGCDIKKKLKEPELSGLNDNHLYQVCHGCKVVTKEMHDQKMLKQLIGHVSWSKLDSPFPMCNETIEKREKKEKMVDK